MKKIIAAAVVFAALTLFSQESNALGGGPVMCTFPGGQYRATLSQPIYGYDPVRNFSYYFPAGSRIIVEIPGATMEVFSSVDVTSVWTSELGASYGGTIHTSVESIGHGDLNTGRVRCDHFMFHSWLQNTTNGNYSTVVGLELEGYPADGYATLSGDAFNDSFNYVQLVSFNNLCDINGCVAYW